MRIIDCSSDVCSSDLLDRARHQQAHFFGIVDDIGVDALDQRMFEALGDLPAAPFLGGLFLRGVAALIAFGERDQSLGRAFGFAFHLAVEDRSEEHTSELQSLMRTSYAVS